MKRQSVKQKQLGHSRIRAAVRTSRSMREAARTLGVDRATLHRWLKADPALKAPIREKREAVKRATAAGELLTPEAWEARIVELYEPDDTERVLINLARRALEIARDGSAKPTERIAAMGRFTQLVKELNMEAPNEAEKPKAKLYAIR